MNILVFLLTVVCCTADAVPLLSEDGGQKETLAMVNGSRPGNVILRQRDKRGVRAVGKWVGETLASSSIGGILSYFISMGLDKLFDNDEITLKLNSISFELNDISAKLQNLEILVLTQSTKDVFQCFDRIAYYGEKLNHKQDGSDELLWEDILNYNTGIRWYLYILSKLIDGSTLFGGLGGVYEPFLVKLLKLYTYGSDMKNFVPIDDLGNKMKNATIKLLEYQKLGYQIKYNATMLKMNSTNRAQMNSMLVRIENDHKDEVKKQNSSILALLKDCPNIKDKFAKKHWLKCTDGFRFGSICTQVCNYPGYPNKGYEPVQCLWNGKWSNNINGETRFMCSNVPRWAVNKKLGYFLENNMKMCKNGACDSTLSVGYGFRPWCYAEDYGWDYCQSTVRPGYVYGDPNRKCKSMCMFIFYLYGWCYVDDAYYNWDYCMPEIMTGEPDRTFRGELCKDRCRGGGWTVYKTCNEYPYGTGIYCAINV